MSNTELLASAMRALRETKVGSCATAEDTRSRILARARRQKRRRRRILAAVMPLAAALAVSTAWAAVTGRLPGWIAMVSGSPDHSQHAPGSVPGIPSGPTDPPAASTVSSAPAPPSMIGPTDLTIEPEGAKPAGEPIPSGGRLRSFASAPLVHKTTQSDSIREQSVYGLAHNAHFSERNPAAALQGWESYLTEYPNGRFATEARYNRAICLVRLGRPGEARVALIPFAEGRFGGYRRAEARGLIDAMTDADSGASTP